MTTSETNGGLARLTRLTAGELIGGEVTVLQSTATMHQAACKFAEFSIGLAPVVDESGHCIGVLSARDFLTYEIERTREATPPKCKPSNKPADGEYLLPWDSVLRFMSTAVQTAPFYESLRRIGEVMLAEHIHHLIVLDERAVPIGVVSTLDVISALIAICDEQNALMVDSR